MQLLNSKRRYSLITFLLVVGSLLWMAGCKHPIPDAVDPVTQPDGGGNGTTVNCDPDTVYFEQQVLPILITNCARSGCHDAATAQEGVVLTSYERIMATADVRPFDPEGSDLYEVLVEDADEEDHMPPPPNEPLQQVQIDLIATWIRQGAKNLSCSDETAACNTENVTFAGTIKPLLQTKCVGCHSATTSSGGVNLTTHAGVVAAASDGRLLGAVSHTQGYSPMPQGGQKLAQCDIDKIAAWIEAGTLNN